VIGGVKSRHGGCAGASKNRAIFTRRGIDGETMSPENMWASARVVTSGEHERASPVWRGVLQAEAAMTRAIVTALWFAVVVVSTSEAVAQCVHRNPSRLTGGRAHVERRRLSCRGRPNSP
jgi:hypothetical protein